MHFSWTLASWLAAEAIGFEIIPTPGLVGFKRAEALNEAAAAPTFKVEQLPSPIPNENMLMPSDVNVLNPRQENPSSSLSPMVAPNVMADQPVPLGDLAITGFPGSIIEAGKPITIKYTGPNLDKPVTITLRKGNPNNLKNITQIANKVTGGTFEWLVSENLPKDSDYALMIEQGGVTNYIGPFQISSSKESSKSAVSGPPSPSEAESSMGKVIIGGKTIEAIPSETTVSTKESADKSMMTPIPSSDVVLSRTPEVSMITVPTKTDGIALPASTTDSTIDEAPTTPISALTNEASTHNGVIQRALFQVVSLGVGLMLVIRC